MIKLLYKLWSKIITFLGDIKFYGYKHPFFIVLNAPQDKIEGKHYREIAKLIKPGDVLLSRSDRYVSTFLIPGYWTHAGFYWGGEEERVIHATSDGVVIEDIINFLRTDHVAILRPKEQYVERAIELAKTMINQEYDFLFNFDDSNRLSCTELIFCCYHQSITPQKRFGKMTVNADDILGSNNFEIIWNSDKV